MERDRLPIGGPAAESRNSTHGCELNRVLPGGIGHPHFRLTRTIGCEQYMPTIGRELRYAFASRGRNGDDRRRRRLCTGPSRFYAPYVGVRETPNIDEYSGDTPLR